MTKITFNQAKKFLNNITPKNKVAIIHHDDGDGYTAAILLHNFLKNKNIKPKVFAFNRNKSKFKNYHLKKFNTILIVDLSPSLIAKDLRTIKHKKIFYTDHHPKDAQIPKQILEYRTKSEHFKTSEND